MSIFISLILFLCIKHSIDNGIPITNIYGYLGIIIQCVAFILDLKITRKLSGGSKVKIITVGAIISLLNGLIFTYLLVHSETGKFGMVEFISSVLFFIFIGIVLSKIFIKYFRI